jgi:hypothetical protein
MTIPALWRILKMSLYSIIIILRAVLERTLSDPTLASDESKWLLRTLQEDDIN